MGLQDLTPQLRTRLSRMERAVGWFVLLATATLAFGFAYYVYHTAKRKGWFLAKAPYFTFVQSATGLKVGDPVQMMGFDVGQITRITSQPPEDYSYNVYVEFTIVSPYYDYLWTEGSRAKVAPADLLGKRTIEVTKGTNGHTIYLFNAVREVPLTEAAQLSDLPQWKLAEDVYDKSETNLIFKASTALSKEVLARLTDLGRTKIRLRDQREKKRNSVTAVWNGQEGAYETYAKTNIYWLLADETPPITERLEQVVGEVQKSLPNVFALTNQLSVVLSNTANLTSNLDAVVLSTRPMISNLALTTASLNHPGALGEWLIPTNLERQLETTLGTADATLVNANGTLVNANTNLAILAEQLSRSLDSLAGITSNLNVQVQANTNLLSAVSQTIVHADEFVQGLRRHWLLRSAFRIKTTNAPPTRPSQPLRSPKDQSSR